MIRFPLLALLPLAFATPAPAQERAADPYAVCAAMAEDDDRLECFDETHARVTVRTAEDSARAEERRTEGFGLDSTRREDLASISEGTITATVVESFTDGSRRRVLLLDNGQLWRERSGSTMRNSVRTGWSGTIERHWSGAYEMRFEGRSGYLRLERIR